MPEGPQVKRVGLNLNEFANSPIIKIERKAISKNTLDVTLPTVIKKVETKGKNIFIFLENGQVIYNHMLMWGKWAPGCEPQVGNKRLHTCFVFQKGQMGYYGGGVLKTITKAEVETIKTRLGPDIITETKEQKAFSLLGESPLPIGEALLAQELVSGIGNIYKSEGLFIAKIDSTKPANLLNEMERKRLFEILHKQMVKDVTYPGIVTTTPSLLEKGFRRYVYKRFHQACLVCQTKIERIYQGQRLSRSTYYCPNCQK